MRTFTFILLICASFTSNAQDSKIKSFQFDFNARNNQPSIKKIKTGEWYTVKFKNLNPYLYNVTYTLHDSTMKVIEPASFTTLFDILTKLASDYKLPDSRVALTTVSGGVTSGTDSSIEKSFQDFLVKLIVFKSKCLNSLGNIFKLNIGSASFIGNSSDYYSNYADLKNDYIILLKASSILDLTDSKQKEIYDTLFKDLHSTVNQLTLLLSNFQEENYSFETLPIQMSSGYQQELKVNFKPNDSIQKIIQMPISPYEFHMTISNDLYFDYGFSTGIYLTKFNHDVYSNKTLYDSVYNTSSSTKSYDKVGYNLVQEKGNSHQLGLHVLAFAGIHFSNYFSLGINMGPGLSFETKPRLLGFTGAYIGFGNQNQFHISYGVAAGMTDKIRQSEKTFVNTVSKDERSDIYNSELETKPYLSISYSFPFALKNK